MLLSEDLTDAAGCEGPAAFTKEHSVNAYENFQRIVTADGGYESESALAYADKAAEAMDPELRQRVERSFDGIPQIVASDYLKFYCDLHRGKFGEEFCVKE